MRSIYIYVEGGGDRKDTRAAIRSGFGAFLGEARQAARRRTIRWQVVACGGRGQAIGDFLTGQRTNRDAFNVLLVDAEGPVSTSPRLHLLGEHPRRSEVDDDQCHLMVQMMEAWLVADVAALERFYGQGFRLNAIPARADVENIDKADLEDALRNATRHTQKGSYHKIRHGAKLLGFLDAATVRSKAPHCHRLFTVLAVKIT